MSLTSQSSGGGGNMTNTIKNILLSNEANKILLEFNSNLDYTTSAIELADFSISINDATGVPPTAGQFTGTNANDVWLSLTTGTVLAGDKVQVTYTADGGNTGKLITAAVPPQTPQDLDFSGGNSGQHYISNGVTQNVDGTTVSLGFPSDTIDAPSNAALTAANNFKVQYSVMEGGNALTKTIDASSAAWNSTNNAIDLTMPSLGNYAASGTSVDINHLTQVRFAPTSAAEALQEFGGGNPIFSAVSDKTVTKSGCISKNPPEQKKASSSDPFCTLTGPGARPVKSGVCPGAMPSSPSVPVA